MISNQQSNEMCAQYRLLVIKGEKSLFYAYYGPGIITHLSYPCNWEIVYRMNC